MLHKHPLENSLGILRSSFKILHLHEVCALLSYGFFTRKINMETLVCTYFVLCSNFQDTLRPLQLNLLFLGPDRPYIFQHKIIILIT